MGCIYFETILIDFCLQISSDAKCSFLTCPRHCDRGLIDVMVYYFQIYFQIWNKKEYNVIIIRVISSHMGPMSIETPYIYTNATT